MSVWVIAEQRNGHLQKVALELLGKGRELSEKLGVKLTAVLVGYEVEKLANTLIKHGADEVIVLENILLKNYTTDGYTNAIEKIAIERKPEIILIGATNIGRDLGPRLAARLKTGLTADCTGLDIDENTKNLLMTRPAFGGNLMATIECPNHRPQMATIRPGVFPLPCPDDRREGRIEKIDVKIKEEEIRTVVEKIVKSLDEKIDITEAKVIVSGGRGIGNKEGFEMLKELAHLLGGVVGASRAAVDAGWIGKDHQVGQTGKTVRPKLYIACGISGAIQHLAGMQESEYIIAINKDENAPIMSIADLGIVGDVYKVLPELINEIKAYKDSCEIVNL
ncbi:electron transfer flavoprotein subunit alpha/FixB family protein [Caloramator sp. Dgby_cultured_2]|uniref:electron transfer flavoprotein subunit alpha/FixB family protein n=1 Tax=Caloramator sp. Dgby_cultured_2 TaxID=3029174 RepID=UPI00237E9EC6|nr:electron transfer flavoprotein subunit alpha/FixB family protein [Caloramator sp. Dgby_cultured_2]WDU82320.1 electron transfer flavoprotein subunit alpha/FixB family protein [Caloramator sp. Dgby_cultured_2]